MMAFKKKPAETEAVKEIPTTSAQAENPTEAADAPLVWVNLRYGFRGRASGERYIEPGLYVWGDPRLMGLEEYLIGNGEASIKE
jgi:hypothetical protein